MMQNGPSGLESSTSPEIVLLIAFAIMLVGVVLAFAGRLVWRNVMSFIGGILGFLFGFTYGTAIGGPIVGLVVGFLGAMIGGTVFSFLMEIGLGVVAGLLAYLVSSIVFDSMLMGVVFAGIAFVVTIVFVDQAIGIVTAIVGGLLVGIGMLWMDLFDMILVVLIMFAVMVFGAALQVSMHRDEQLRKNVMMAAAAAPAVPAAVGRTCPKCSGSLTYIPEYNRHYCYKCQRYE